MFGIETFEVLIFFRQAGLAVSGAAAFWGFIFLFFSRRTTSPKSSSLWKLVAKRLLYIFFPALFLYGIVWATIAITQCAFCSAAHEGISIAETPIRLAAITYAQYASYVALMIVGFLGFTILLFKRVFLNLYLSWFYGAAFILISLLFLYPWDSLGSVNADISVSLHGWHSIFTVGSVILIDFLFISLRPGNRLLLKKIFPLITLGIWLGLGLDFVSAGLVLPDKFFFVDRVLFMQTLIGIVIINGVLLAGPISRAIIASREFIKSDELKPKLQRIAGLSGAISISGWLSVTALDGFKSITLNYWQLAMIYILLIALIFVSRSVIEKFIVRYSRSN